MKKLLILCAMLLLLCGCESMIKKILDGGANGPAGLPGKMK